MTIKIIQQGLVVGPEDIVNDLPRGADAITDWGVAHSSVIHRILKHLGERGLRWRCAFDAAHGCRHMLQVWRTEDELNHVKDFVVGGPLTNPVDNSGIDMRDVEATAEFLHVHGALFENHSCDAIKTKLCAWSRDLLARGKPDLLFVPGATITAYYDSGMLRAYVTPQPGYVIEHCRRMAGKLEACDAAIAKIDEALVMVRRPA